MPEEKPDDAPDEPTDEQQTPPDNSKPPRDLSDDLVTQKWIRLTGFYLAGMTVLILLGLFVFWPKCELMPGDQACKVQLKKTAEFNVGSNGLQTQSQTPAQTAQTQTQPASTSLKIASVSPQTGSIEGGTMITILGSGFEDRSMVTIGGAFALSKMIDSTVLLACTPPHEEAKVDVTVRNRDGKEEKLADAIKYTCPERTGTSLLIIVMLAGALGGLVHSLRSLYWYVGNRLLKRSWLSMYYLLPFIGAAMAVIFFVIIQGGFFGPDSNREPFWIVSAVAIIVGLFSQQAALKLQDIANAVLTKPGEGSDARPQESKNVQSPSKTTALKIAAVSVTTGLAAGGTSVTVTGEGFTQETTLLFDNAPATEIKCVGPTSMSAKTPQHPAGKVDITVKNPDGSKSTLKNGFTYT